MADVVEYGRHMREDEPGTISTVRPHFSVAFPVGLGRKTRYNEGSFKRRAADRTWLRPRELLTAGPRQVVIGGEVALEKER